MKPRAEYALIVLALGLLGIAGMVGYKIGQHHPIGGQVYSVGPIQHGNVEMQPWLEPLYPEKPSTIPAKGSSSCTCEDFKGKPLWHCDYGTSGNATATGDNSTAITGDGNTIVRGDSR